MTDRYPETRRPLEETPEAAAAVEDETTVPQLTGGGGPNEESPRFREPNAVEQQIDTGGEDIIGDAMGGASPTAAGRTGAEQPWEPEDLAVAEGQDPTPRNLDRARRELAEDGPAAIEKTVP